MMKPITILALCAVPLLIVAACGDDDDDGHEHDHDAGPDGGKAGTGGGKAGTGGGRAGTGGGQGGRGGTSARAGSGGGGMDGGAADASAGSGGSSGSAGSAGSSDEDASVDDEDGGDEPQLRAVTIRFKAKVGSSDFVCGQSYTGQGSTSVEVRPKDFRFYVQDLRLITSAGDEVPVTHDIRSPWQSETVALLDFENGESDCSGEGDADLNTTITGTVPEGDYTGVAFVNGVPENLNHGDPTTLPAPLQKGGLTWGWLFGYRFMKAELVQVVTPPAIPGEGYAHAGSTGCTGTEATGFTCTNQNRNQIRLTDFDPDTDTIVADVGALFAESDLSVSTQCHGSGSACTPIFARLGIDFATGAPAATQQIYRVE